MADVYPIQEAVTGMMSENDDPSMLDGDFSKLFEERSFK
jgi:hypothetical protein